MDIKIVSTKEAFSLINSNEHVFVDTRTPLEFEIDQVYGAVNLPLLEDEERKEIGILYKQGGKEKAIGKGYEIVTPKIEEMLNKFKKISKTRKKKLIVYCWRGGMRSRSVVELLSNKGYDAIQLEGGYKSYREHIRNRLKNYKLKPKLIVIKGLTGTGKTDFLRKTKLAKMDLEELAQHRSSVFGKIGLQPRTQKMFETLLYFKLEKLKYEPYVLIEGESRKVGNIILPEFLYKAMNTAKHIILVCDLKKRANITIKEYGQITKKHGKELKKIVASIRKKLSRKTFETLNKHIDQKETQEFVELLLTDYYDPLYKFQIEAQKEDSIVVKNTTFKKVELQILAAIHDNWNKN